MGGGFGGFFGGGEPAKEVETTIAPTGFETLPDFGQEAFRQAFEQGTGFAGTADAFAPASLLPQQQAALETLGVRAYYPRRPSSLRPAFKHIR